MSPARLDSRAHGPGDRRLAPGPGDRGQEPDRTFGPGRPARGRQANSPFRRAFFPGPHYSANADGIYVNATTSALSKTDRLLRAMKAAGF